MMEHFVIQSDISLLPLVEERLFHFCQLNHVGNYHSTIDVAVLQAVENAIVHGNGGEVEKTVDITFGTCRGGVFVEVEDQGAGFDYECYVDHPEGAASEGEGIFVMCRLADRVRYDEGGRKVRLEFDVAGIDPGDAMERVAILQRFLSPVEVGMA